LEHHPSYLTSNFDLHKASLFLEKRHSHFPKRARLNKSGFLTDKLPEEIGVQIDQLTRWNLNSYPT